MEGSNPGEADNERIISRHELIKDILHSNLKPTGSLADVNAACQMSCSRNNMLVPPSIIFSTPTTNNGADVQNNSEFSNRHIAQPVNHLECTQFWLQDEVLPEITFCDVTMDCSVLQSSNAVTSPMSTKQSKAEKAGDEHSDFEKKPSLTSALENTSVVDPKLGNTTKDSVCLTASLQVTEDIYTVSNEGDNETLTESSVKNTVKTSGSVVIQSPAEPSLDEHPKNVTRDISSSIDKSSQFGLSQSSTSDMDSKNCPNNCTYDLEDEPMENSNPNGLNNEEAPSKPNPDFADKVPQPSRHPAESLTDLNTSAPATCLQNTTLALHKTNAVSAGESDAKHQDTLDFSSQPCDQPCGDTDAPTLELNEQSCPESCDSTVPLTSSGAISSLSTTMNAADTSPGINQDNVATKTSDVVQNSTFDLEKSNGNNNLEPSCVTSTGLHNNSSDTKSLSVTITLSKTVSDYSGQNPLNDASSPKPCIVTMSPKGDSDEVHPPELSKYNETTADVLSSSQGVGSGTTASGLETNPVRASGDVSGETKQKSQPELPPRLSDLWSTQIVDVENESNTFTLDDALDLNSHCLITSTPMTNCKILSSVVEREGNKPSGVQKKLYHNEPAGHAQLEGPSNIIGDQKMFLTHPAVKSLLPPLKATSEMLKYKLVPMHLGRTEPLTRQRAQAEALKGAPGVNTTKGPTGIPRCYNLRAATTVSRVPHSGLQKPQSSAIPSASQRVTRGLKLPSAKCNTQGSLGAAKALGPTEAPKALANAGASKLPCDLSRSKALKRLATSQIAVPTKVKRDDAVVPSASCEPTSKASNLKRLSNNQKAVLAKAQSNGCAKCHTLQEQLKVQSDEIKRLKEELLKKNL
ncbi:uncharacterized protein LOC117531285 isoform X2 [Thalassophryne amazonica]|uniref:uncharacterized protein LOC117531285 isoform X2 n=1 Tax=Thalassophryne amazonica TaxID=390379 RepID=UPI0014712B49|nr:uncharacterized protein LOC117531285 isoform X2 [Thalassophryne amazonica]